MGLQVSFFPLKCSCFDYSEIKTSNHGIQSLLLVDSWQSSTSLYSSQKTSSSFSKHQAFCFSFWLFSLRDLLITLIGLKCSLPAHDVSKICVHKWSPYCNLPSQHAFHFLRGSYNHNFFVTILFLYYFICISLYIYKNFMRPDTLFLHYLSLYLQCLGVGTQYIFV